MVMVLIGKAIGILMYTLCWFLLGFHILLLGYSFS